MQAHELTSWQIAGQTQLIIEHTLITSMQSRPHCRSLPCDIMRTPADTSPVYKVAHHFQARLWRSMASLLIMSFLGSMTGSQQCCRGSPESPRGSDVGDVVLVLIAPPRHDVSKDVVPPVAGDTRWRQGVAWNIVGARIAIVPMKVVCCYVRVLVGLSALHGSRAFIFQAS